MVRLCLLFCKTNLTTLSMLKCGISDDKARTLAKHVKDWTLTELNLAENNITEAGTNILLSAYVNSSIKRLDLGVKLPVDFMEALKNLKLHRLCYLYW